MLALLLPVSARAQDPEWDLKGPASLSRARPMMIRAASPPTRRLGRNSVRADWTMLLTLPFMAAIQIISACIGWETSAGLARNIKRELPAVVLYGWSRWSPSPIPST